MHKLDTFQKKKQYFFFHLDFTHFHYSIDVVVVSEYIRIGVCVTVWRAACSKVNGDGFFALFSFNIFGGTLVALLAKKSFFTFWFYCFCLCLLLAVQLLFAFQRNLSTLTTHILSL